MEMEYKGYIGKIELDTTAEIFHGEVTNLRDVVTFQGESVKELRKALEDSVEDYLEFCAERSEEPERPFSGKFLIRTTPTVHRELSTYARRKQLSLNSLVNMLFDKFIIEENSESTVGSLAADNKLSSRKIHSLDDNCTDQDNESAQFPLDPAKMQWACPDIRGS